MSVRVTVDDDICTGHGRCYVLAPAVFDTDDHGRCVVRIEIIEDGLADAARAGEANCPEQAITVTDA